MRQFVQALQLAYRNQKPPSGLRMARAVRRWWQHERELNRLVAVA